MIAQISIERPYGELCVDVSSESPSVGYAAESKSGYNAGDEIPLTPSEQADAEERMLSAAISLAKRDIDFTVDDYAPTGAEMDREGDRYFENRLRR